MVGDSGPSVRQRNVARVLRSWRSSRELTLQQVAQELGWSVNRLSRYERGEGRGAGASDIIALATVLRVDEDERNRVVEAGRRAQQNEGWWSSYAQDVVPGYVKDILETEADAQATRTVEMMFMPGLLQTDAYMDGLMGAGAANPSAAKEHADGWREVRQKRQARLQGPNPLHLHAIVHETALRFPVGSPATMREQLGHLIEKAGQPNVTLQVIPTAHGPYPGVGIAWQMFSFDGEQWVTFIDHLQGGLPIEDQELVATYDSTFTRLAKLALDPQASVRFITEARTASDR